MTYLRARMVEKASTTVAGFGCLLAVAGYSGPVLSDLFRLHLDHTVG